jgi:S1-C subfamily serine protease
LKTGKGTTEYLSFADTGAVSLGDWVFTVGFPVQDLLGNEVKFSEGSVSSTSGPTGEFSLLQISVPIQPGNSGGPVVNDKGEVVGIVTASAHVLAFAEAAGTLPQAVNWAVKAEYALPLVGRVPARHPATGREDAIRRAEKAVCSILAVS